jgi:hypothetical protein
MTRTRVDTTGAELYAGRLMKTMTRMARRAMAAWLSTLTIALSVAIPVFERADLAVTDTAEGQHDPGNCPAPHDHTICIQVRASFSAPSVTPGHQRSLVFAWRPGTVTPTPAAASYFGTAKARSPPVA